MKTDFASITRKASKSFYTASLFFPKDIRNDVFILYSFLRRADDMIDNTPPLLHEYEQFKLMTYKAIKNETVPDDALNEFGKLVSKHQIKILEIESFFKSLELDLRTNSYKSYDDLREFTYGVAEVVGIMMSRVMGLHENAFESAKELGLAMQMLNILRDIKEDDDRSKTYIPQDELKRFGLPEKLTEKNIHTYKDEYNEMMLYQIKRVEEIIIKARLGFHHIPKRLRLPIQIAADIYERYLILLKNSPSAKYNTNLKPSYYTIGVIVLKNYFSLYATS